jgi:GNAT superfamily N-acetyltransferase
MPDPSPTPRLRTATPDDLPDLGELVDRSIRGLAPGSYDAAQIDSSLRHLFGVDTQLVADGTYYVVEVAGRIVACGGWSRRRTPYGGDNVAREVRSGDVRMPGRDAAVIRAFFVDPAWTRRGLGRMMLEASERAAAAAGFDRFELTATLMGRPLYAAAGYREVHPMPITLPDGQVLANVHMEKP